MSVVEQRTYTLKAEFGPADYFKLYDGEPRRVQCEALGGFLGYFAAEVGELNAVTSLWRYVSFDDRMERRTALSRTPAWQAFLGEVRPILLRLENRLLVPADFSPLR